ncbi:hypothetical protein [Rossellomorea sp. BNER]|uniref:hypothetical protein n=1 Tax=Rossellomorea sp. BNER TaxID=2962031 RepID=UPI003AF29ABF|nr:hypothetical protein [Rossellomorea sp. BNER]
MKKIKTKLYVLSVLSVLAITAILFEDKLLNTDQSAVHISYELANAQCEDCLHPLNTAMQNIIGVEKYVFNEKTNTLKIKYDPSVTQDKWIKKALSANGYRIEER